MGARSYSQQKAVSKMQNEDRRSGMYDTYSRNVHSCVCYDTIKDRSFDQFGRDGFAIQDGETDVWVFSGINFAEVNLAIFFADEADEVCPIGAHFCTQFGKILEKVVVKVLDRIIVVGANLMVF